MKQKLNCVLIVDDDEPTNFISRMLIENAGCAEYIYIAQSGKEALNYLTCSKNFEGKNNILPSPDLIFLDINMPAMNGWEFLDKFKKLNKKNEDNIILVMLTTSLFPEDKFRASEIPEISAFEKKPLTPEKLDIILKKHFSDRFL